MCRVGFQTAVTAGELPTYRAPPAAPRKGAPEMRYTPSDRLSRQKKSQSKVSVTFSPAYRSRVGCRSIMLSGPTGLSRLKYAPDGNSGLNVWRFGEAGLLSPLVMSNR